MSRRPPSLATIGPYRVIDCVGAGGMGTVYRVWHRRTGQVAAAKVLHADAVGRTGLERFRNEARIHQALVHPCIATVHEYLELDGIPCLVMEYVDGETLDDRLRRRGPLPYDVAMRYFAALVDAVGYVHQRGVVHRDLKTNNVKLDGRGGVKLLDFGIATARGTPRLTTTGNVVGTLLALSPEQLRTGHAEPRSDIWALGIVLYEMLTGRPPFDAMAPGLLTERILRGKYVSPSQRRPELPREVDRIVDRCLRVQLEDRYASCEAVLTDVQALETGAVGLSSGARRVSGDLFSQSGEFAQAFVRQWPLVASIGAAFAALLFLTLTLLPSGASNGGGTILADTGRGAGSPAVPVQRQGAAPVLPSEFDVPLARAARDTDRPVRPVMIRVVQGEADVYQDGRRVGRTPYRFEAPLGAEVAMLLRRDGCEDTPVKLRVEEGMGEFIESMRRCRAP